MTGVEASAGRVDVLALTCIKFQPCPPARTRLRTGCVLWRTAMKKIEKERPQDFSRRSSPAGSIWSDPAGWAQEGEAAAKRQRVQ